MIKMTINPGTIKLARIVFVLKLARTSSKGEINVKLPKVSAQVVPYMNPRIGVAVKNRTIREAVTALMASILPIFIFAIELVSLRLIVGSKP